MGGTGLAREGFMTVWYETISVRRARASSTHGPGSRLVPASRLTSAKRGIVDQVASMGTGQVATSSGFGTSVGTVPPAPVTAAMTRVQADRLKTSGPTPVSTMRDRSTPVLSAGLLVASAAVQQVGAKVGARGTPGGKLLGSKLLGTAQPRSTTRVGGTWSGPRRPRKSESPSAVTSPPPKRVKPKTAKPASSRNDSSAPRWFQKVIDEQSAGPPAAQSAPKRNSTE